MITKKFKAQAYIGIVWLQTVGHFEFEYEAREALQENLDKQLENELDEDKEAITESFWANSQITKMDNQYLYLDYVNNFLTVEKFADYYGLSSSEAHRLINGKGL